ncbi:MAG TPA: NBR1-Ig-like domain-containing protein, partial [Chloroflexota bacterium]
MTAGDGVTFIIGAGGAPGTWKFNGNYVCSPSGTTGTRDGANGGNTSVWSNSAGTQLGYATGGGAGTGSTGDNCIGQSGAGGWANGAPGGAINCTRNSYPQTPGGYNGTGFQNMGGYSNGWSGLTAACPTPGGNGYASITYSCVSDTPYTETNPTSIANYCSAQGVTCPAGQQYVSSLSCHEGGGTWQPYGSYCTAANCTGCGCVSAAPTVTLYPFSPSTIVTGQSSTISFTSTNATSCSGTGLWNGNLGGTSATNASTGVMNTAGTYSQSVTCTGAGGSATSATQYLTVQTNNASCTSLTVPSTLTAGQTFTASATLQNTGNSTWTSANGYKLGSQSPQDNTTWGVNRIALPSTTAPGSSATFSGTLTAPSTPGTYTFAWQMVEEYVQWFGATCSQSVTVTGATSCPATTISGCSLPATASGGSAGSCASGYSGSCSYTCSNGTWSANSNSCTASITAPSVSTSAVSGITSSSAASGGTINSNGGATVTVSGIVWSTSANPTTTSYLGKTTDGWAVGGPWSDS